MKKIRVSGMNRSRQVLIVANIKSPVSVLNDVAVKLVSSLAKRR